MSVGLTLAVRVAMYAVAAFSLASAIAALNEISAFDELMSRLLDVTSADLAAAEQLSEGFVGLSFWVGTAAAGATIVWWYRAYRAVVARGTEGLRWSPGWAVGGWFIPIGNVIIPKLVLNEIDRVSGAGHDHEWRSRPVTPLTNVWWAVWVGGVVLSVWGALTVAGQTVAAEFDASTYRTGLVVGAAGFAVSTVAGFLGAAVVRILGARLAPGRD